MARELEKENRITDVETLEALYGPAAANSLRKECDHIHPLYRKMVEVTPFAVLATNGPNGPDASPRGDSAGFIQVVDEKTILLPDRRGNNRLDSLRNILHDPSVALLCLIPGVGETLRIHGEAAISTNAELRNRYAVNGKLPASVLVICVNKVFFQCSRAIVRSGLWDSARHVDRASLPSVGTILETLSAAEVDGTKYDADLPERVQKTLY